MRGAIDARARTLPGPVSWHVLAGRGHWIQQEAEEEEVTGLLIDWLRSTSLAAG
jgi:pimeloyl-ACP methyl ester carboxylesterase